MRRRSVREEMSEFETKVVDGLHLIFYALATLIGVMAVK